MTFVTLLPRRFYHAEARRSRREEAHTEARRHRGGIRSTNYTITSLFCALFAFIRDIRLFSSMNYILSAFSFALAMVLYLLFGPNRPSFNIGSGSPVLVNIEINKTFIKIVSVLHHTIYQAFRKSDSGKVLMMSKNIF